MFDWPSRPTKVKCRYRITGENPRRVLEIGKYQVEVPDDPEADVTYHVPAYGRGEKSEPRAHFPNMEVRDGALTIPLEDITASILARVEPAEIAKALWQNEDVRAEFLDCLSERWREGGVNDSDRRKFLRKINEAIFSKALDEFAYAAQKLEHAFGRKWFFYHEINRVNEWLHGNDVRNGDGETIRLRHEDHDPRFKIGGADWNEARDHWRDEALKLFAMPKEEIEAAVDADAVPF